MWGDSDDEDDINPEEETFEKDSKTKGEAIDEEMRTKEDDDDERKTGRGNLNHKLNQRMRNPQRTTLTSNSETLMRIWKKTTKRNTGVDVRTEEDAKGEEDDDMDRGDELRT
jgi:hypothetical protein